VTDTQWLAQQFEDHRSHLSGVAYRMLGSRADADDAVQEAWLRISRAGAESVENLGGWLTTVVARVCLDMLRSRKSRREEPALDSGAAIYAAAGDDPEQEAIVADAVGAALMIVLDSLNPAERVAFVLHDIFEVPFEQIAPVIDKSVVATRQLASRARRRIRLANADETTRARDDVVSAFLSAAREGNVARLLQVLDPSVVLRADAATQAIGSQAMAVGSEAVVNWFAGRAKAAQPALIDGTPGLVWVQGGELRVVFAFGFESGRISSIDLIADAQRIAQMQIDF
jgi:RNA polymerase sigma factor (sigma-70 family)